MTNAKRHDQMPPDTVQSGNRTWWTQNTMSYDWKDRVTAAPLSRDWFDEIDARFVHAARLFATEKEPFDRILPLASLRGARVLEIGCGMGLHTELMARAGAHVTAVDLSPTSVEATRARLQLKALDADVKGADAEALPFDDRAFDFVWSWGVIHHSARTARIVREIARVLAVDGTCRVMVYNRHGASVAITLLRDYLLKGRFLRESFEEVLYSSTDGFSARHYVAEQFEDLFRAFFSDVSSEIMGQDADAVPLPARLRRIALKFLSEDKLRWAQSRWGSFIFLRAARPC